MKLWVGITDDNWFKLLASKDFLEEVNFWRPSHRPYRKDFEPGMPFLFKLHAPDNYIVGGGFFLKFLSLPLSLAWDSFGEGNGARSLEEFRTLIGSYRPIALTEDPLIGCTILSEPFFFDKPDWIPSAPYLKGPIVAGKGNFESSVALALWQGVASRLAAGAARPAATAPGPATIAAQAHDTARQLSSPHASAKARSAPSLPTSMATAARSPPKELCPYSSGSHTSVRRRRSTRTLKRPPTPQRSPHTL